MSCSGCGSGVGNDLVFCPACGTMSAWFSRGAATAVMPSSSSLTTTEGVSGVTLGPPPLPATWIAPPGIEPLASPRSAADSPRNSSDALIYAALLFVGVGGLHRFYTGRAWSGLFQLMTGGGFLIWQLIDVVRLAAGTFTDADGRRVRAR